jgi:predicted RNA-binding Zn-ribbon protein involved in translation (DUF1610 family)
MATNNLIVQCPRCGDAPAVKRLQSCADGRTTHMRLECGRCGKWLGWAPQGKRRKHPPAPAQLADALGDLEDDIVRRIDGDLHIEATAAAQACDHVGDAMEQARAKYGLEGPKL